MSETMIAILTISFFPLWLIFLAATEFLNEVLDQK